MFCTIMMCLIKKYYERQKLKLVLRVFIKVKIITTMGYIWVALKSFYCLPDHTSAISGEMKRELLKAKFGVEN